MADSKLTPPVKVSPYAPIPAAYAPNIVAFLSTIAVSEGTFGEGDNGYNVLAGGKLFEGYADHPRVQMHIEVTNRR